MASVSTNQKTGTRRVLFVRADGKRTALHVGHVSKATAAEIGSHVDRLVLCQQSGKNLRRATRQWVEHIRCQWPRLARRLASHGLIAESTTSAASRQQGNMSFADFADRLIADRKDLSPNTIQLRQQTAVRIREFFGSLAVDSLTAKHGNDFKRWLLSPADSEGAGYSVASAGKHMAETKSFLKEAVDGGIITTNPFIKITIERQVNRNRQRFIDASVITQVISLVDDHELKAVIALARWGGLRTPSEPFAMQWKHIDWDRKRIEIQSVKTKSKGRPTREIPLFPELVPFLTTLREAERETSPDGFLIPALRRFTGENLRKRMASAIRRGGFEVWPRIFRNLRSSRQTELEERFPRKTVCEWMGNSEQVADQHYLQVRDEHFERAVASAEVPIVDGQGRTLLH